MVLLQLGITLDDICLTDTSNSYFTQSQNSIRLGGATNINAPSFTFTPKILRNVNLPSGRYRCNIVGFEVASAQPDITTFAFSPQIIQIRSPQFITGAGQGIGLCFSNNGQYSISDTGGKKEIYIELAGNWIELEVRVAQFSASSQLILPFFTWSNSCFAFFILSLDVELENAQCLFGNAK